MRISSKVLSAAIGIAMVPGIALVGAPPATAISSSAKTSFIAKITAPAQAAQTKFGVPSAVLIAQAIVASDWGAAAPAGSANNYFGTPCSAAMTAAQFAKLAEAQVGKPYVLGAEAALTTADPAKFDCSELVQWLFGRSGNPITDLAASQYNVTKAVAKGDSPRVGDLVFLRNNPARSNGIGHVAVVTKKLASGEWEIIEARGRASGVVRTTLSYWKSRSYYAGLRRYPSLVFATGDGVSSSAANLYQNGCVTVSSTQYAKFSSITNSFYGQAAAITTDAAYAEARAVLNDIPKLVQAIAKVERPGAAAEYAASLQSLIDSYRLTDYEVVPFTIVLSSGDKGTKVTALQQLLLAGGTSVKTTGTFDSATVKAVKKFQSAQKLTADGEAGPKTLTALFTTLEPGATGARVQALHALLTGIGLPATAGSSFGNETLAGVKAFQTAAGRGATGVVDANTWALLYMTPTAPVPTVAGTPKVTQTLTATTGKWGPGSVALSYQWYRDAAPIEGATALTYVVQPADAGTKLSIAVTGTKAGYTTVSRFSAATAMVTGALLTAPKTPRIEGKAAVGSTLGVATGTWSPGPVDFTYQWYRGSKAIPGATAGTYVVQAADLGKKLKVALTGSRPGYVSLARTSSASRAVTKGSLSSNPTPLISGNPVVGETLTAAAAWAPERVALSYRWYRGKKAIKGATKVTYTLQKADSKAKIKVKVTGTAAGYSSVSKYSAATPAVAKAGQLKAATPKISGTAKVGKTLTAAVGTWAPEAVDLAYRWFRGGKKISGATEAAYTLKSADKGNSVSVRVTGSKAGYDTASKKSRSVKVK